MNRLIVLFATKVYRIFFPYVMAIVSLPTYFVKYRKYHAVGAVEKGFADHSVESLVVSDELITRLCHAYMKSKIVQKNISKPYQVGHLWQEILDTRFKALVIAIDKEDLITVKNILKNFNRDDCGYDTCGGYQYYHRMKHVPLYKYQFINSWYNRYNACKETIGIEPEFNMKSIGNPVGMYQNGQTIPLCNLEYHCYSWQIADLLKPVSSPVMCEIGGGVGGQAHEVLAHGIPNLKYILLDIPEVLLISSYYLLMAHPEKKFLLYGEGNVRKSRYDVALMPNFVLSQLEDNSVDLFFNSCSFSEMNYETEKEYLSQIERACKCYLMHINHNARLVWYEDGERITNMIADEVVPNHHSFERVYKSPRLFELLEDTFVIHLFYRARYYQYLYRKVAA